MSEQLDAPEPIMGRPRARAVVSSAISVVLLVLLVAGLVAGIGGPSPADAIVRAAVIVGWAAAGYVVWAQGRMLTPVVLAGATFGAAAALGAALLAQDPVAHPDAARALELIGGGLVVAALMHAIVALPDGCLSSPLLRRIGTGIYTICIAAGVVLFLLPRRAAHLLGEVLALGVVAIVALSAVSTLRRYNRLAAADRRTGQWIAAGGALAGTAAVIVSLGAVVVRWPPDAALACLAATLPVPVAVATDATTLSGRSDRALVRTLTWLGSVVAAAAITAVVVVAIGHRPTGSERGLLALGLLAGVLVLAAWEPIRQWSHARAAEFTYGDRPPPDAALTTLGARLSRSIPLEDLLDDVAAVLHLSQAPSGAALWTGRGRLLERSAAAPAAPPDGTSGRAIARLELPPAALVDLRDGRARDETWLRDHLPALCEGHEADRVRVLPLTHQGELFGLVQVARPGNGDPFAEVDERILGELAVQLGLALHNVQLDSTLSETMEELRRQAEELQASRARLVSAANTERRRLERNLHDGAQQQLVGLAVTIGLARDLLQSDPAEAAKLLERVTADVRLAIDELRSLARGIFPPLLADRGLGEAVTAAARRSPVAAEVSATVGRYGSDVEAAVYFCCLEGLQNAAKHAPASNVEVVLADDGTTLSFLIRDDGPGFDPDSAVMGDGFLNMTDRMGALGGRIEVESRPGGGTTVRGVVPLGSAD